MAQIDPLFQIMVSQGASDLHLSAGTPPYLRIDGEMHKAQYRELTHAEIKDLVFETLSDKQKADFIKNWELDYGYSAKGVGRFRCNIFVQRRGMGAVFRTIPEEIKSLEDLGMNPQLYEHTKNKNGLILVTGPTGSGKSTTLAALINYINMHKSEHIITVEDPIEFIHKPKSSLINQREVHSHTKSFSNALRAAMREDPDVILVGELRDLETIQLSVTAAETGHLVLGTLHTTSAAQTIDRIIDVFPVHQQKQIQSMLAESLRAVISQTLLKKKGGGRVAALEVMVNSRAVANLIREGKTYQIPSMIETGSKVGMNNLKQAIDALIKTGQVDKEEAMKYLHDQGAEDPFAA